MFKDKDAIHLSLRDGSVDVNDICALLEKTNKPITYSYPMSRGQRDVHNAEIEVADAIRILKKGWAKNVDIYPKRIHLSNLEKTRR